MDGQIQNQEIHQVGAMRLASIICYATVQKFGVSKDIQNASKRLSKT